MRRMNGEGTLRYRSDGRWEIRVMQGYRDDGKVKYKYFYGRTKKLVLEKFESYRDDLRNGINPNANFTFLEWSEFWFENHKPNISRCTQNNYRHMLNRLQAWFGYREIREVKPLDIEMFLKDLKSKGISDSYVSGFRGMLFQIFHKAEANDLVRKNPVRFAEKIRSNGPKKRREAFSTEEVSLLMEHLPKDKYGMSIRLMLGTGMRTQELLALEPHHIEEDGSLIRIRQAVSLDKGTVYVSVPKTKDSYRDVPVPECVRWCARELRKTSTKFIFEEKKKDYPCNPSFYRDEFRKAVASVNGVRQLTPHSCRHTYVSQMQSLGVDLATIQSIVGHASIDMTQHYLHVQKEIQEQAVKKFTEMFSKDEPIFADRTSARCSVIQFPTIEQRVNK